MNLLDAIEAYLESPERHQNFPVRGVTDSTGVLDPERFGDRERAIMEALEKWRYNCA